MFLYLHRLYSSYQPQRRALHACRCSTAPQVAWSLLLLLWRLRMEAALKLSSSCRELQTAGTSSLWRMVRERRGRRWEGAALLLHLPTILDR